MTEQADPRAQYRQLPEPVTPDEFVEVRDAEPPLPVETPAHVDLRQLASGGGPV